MQTIFKTWLKTLWSETENVYLHGCGQFYSPANTNYTWTRFQVVTLSRRSIKGCLVIYFWLQATKMVDMWWHYQSVFFALVICSTIRRFRGAQCGVHSAVHCTALHCTALHRGFLPNRSVCYLSKPFLKNHKLYI